MKKSHLHFRKERDPVWYWKNGMSNKFRKNSFIPLLINNTAFNGLIERDKKCSWTISLFNKNIFFTIQQNRFSRTNLTWENVKYYYSCRKKNWHILDTEDITWTNIKITTIYRKTISLDMTGPTSLHEINLYIMKWFDLMTKIFLSIFTY